jgi:peptidoglycan-associated lipoprotein
MIATPERPPLSSSKDPTIMTRLRLALPALLLLLAACASTPEDEIGSAAAGSEGLGNGAPGSATELGSDGGLGMENDVFGSAVPGTVEDFEINVGDRVFFDFDSSTLNDDARATLDRQAAWLQQFSEITVTIEGHTDERGTREYNLALGERRATAARNYLVALGVDPGRMLTISYGEERPVDPGTDETAYRQNRRAVTVINLVN